MSNHSRYLYALTFIIAATGFLLPFWPLSVVGVLIAALSGRYVFALVVGILLDLGWGMPVGALHYLFFPFTLLSVVASLARAWGGKYFLDRTPPETL